MAQEPGELFLFARPAVGTPVKSDEVRNNFDALAQLNRTSKPEFPTIKKDGMPRFLTEDLNNVRLQIWFDNAWRTIVQNIQLGIPAPAKLEATFNPAPVGPTWTIDHGLGSRPLVQVFDLAGNQLELAKDLPVTFLPLGGVPPPVLTTDAGPTVRSLPATFRGTISNLLLRAAEPVTGTPAFTLQAAINGTPTTGGLITVSATLALGANAAGTPATALNAFDPGDSLEISYAAGTPPTGGFIETYLEVTKGLQAGQYSLVHSTLNRVVITHPVATAGFAIVLG